MAMVNQKVRIFIIDWRGLYSGIQKDEFFRETLDEWISLRGMMVSNL
jgi:hypothetical protein